MFSDKSATNETQSKNISATLFNTMFVFLATFSCSLERRWRSKVSILFLPSVTIVYLVYTWRVYATNCILIYKKIILKWIINISDNRWPIANSLERGRRRRRLVIIVICYHGHELNHNNHIFYRFITIKLIIILR